MSCMCGYCSLELCVCVCVCVCGAVVVRVESGSVVSLVQRADGGQWRESGQNKVDSQTLLGQET